ncbi:hypothetical protein ACTXT7_002682 [Hymenolepis weldensis]
MQLYCTWLTYQFYFPTISSWLNTKDGYHHHLKQSNLQKTYFILPIYASFRFPHVPQGREKAKG